MNSSPSYLSRSSYLSEQWTTAADPDLAVTTRGSVPPADVTRAVRAIGRVLRRHHLDVPARVRVTAPEDLDQPTVVQANIRMHDTPTRVQVTGPRGFAVTFAVERLDRQISRLVSHESRSWPDPARPPLSRITERRPIIRRKECALLTGTPDEAAAVMDAMDYDSYLFVDAETGEDAVVYWADTAGIVLARQRSVVAPAEPADRLLTEPMLPVAVRPDPTPTLTEDEASTWLCRSGLAFLFFTDERTGRGTLLYRRYDGDLTVVVPA